MAKHIFYSWQSDAEPGAQGDDEENRSHVHCSNSSPQRRWKGDVKTLAPLSLR